MIYKSLCLALMLMALVVGCSRRPNRPQREAGVSIERLPKLEVTHPRRGRLKRFLEVSATVEALKKVEISARVPGVVGQLDDKMDIGRKVKEGEVLLRLDVPDLEADREHKQALLEQARKQEKLAKETLVVTRREVEENEKEEKRYAADVAFHKSRTARIRDLVQRRAQEPQILEEAMRQYEAAEAALGANKARTAKQEARVQAAIAEVDLAAQRIKVAQAAVKRLDEQIGFATVKAPFNGEIIRRWVDPGAIIKDPGATLFTVVQVNRVRVLIDIPQRDVSNLNTTEQNPNPDGRGDPVVVRLPNLAEKVKDGEFHGFITRRSGALDPVTRTMRAEIELDNKGGYLKPGMYGTAYVLIEDRSNVLTVPGSALVRRGEGAVEIYCVAETTGSGDERPGILRRIPVVLGIDDGKEVEIREGLKGDELIVARGSGAMRADDRVIAVSEREPEPETRVGKKE
jgi:RND family efflux transporter MFP subunit